MTGHTPGPWGFRDGSDRGMGVWVDAPSAIVENDRGPSYTREILEDEDYPEKVADARLIAAAPEMLAALKAVIDSAADYHATMQKIRAAIVKAEDPQP